MSEQSGGLEPNTVSTQLASLVPTFNPATDDVMVYRQKVELVLAAWPKNQTRWGSQTQQGCIRTHRCPLSLVLCLGNWVTPTRFWGMPFWPLLVFACGPKTVPVKRTFLNIAIVGWGGVGGHVNVPCTSYMIYCHAAKISGIAYYVTCCYAAEISGIVYYVTCGYAAEISGIVYYVTCCYAAEISGIAYYVTFCYAAEISGIVYNVTCRYAAEISGIVYYVTCCYAAEISGIVYYIHKNADCQLITVHALQRWRWKTKKTRPKFFQDFQSSNQHDTAVKSPLFFNVRFMGTVSGPAGCFC